MQGYAAESGQIQVAQGVERGVVQFPVEEDPYGSLAGSGGRMDGREREGIRRAGPPGTRPDGLWKGCGPNGPQGSAQSGHPAVLVVPDAPLDAEQDITKVQGDLAGGAVAVGPGVRPGLDVADRGDHRGGAAGEDLGNLRRPQRYNRRLRTQASRTQASHPGRPRLHTLEKQLQRVKAGIAAGPTPGLKLS